MLQSDRKKSKRKTVQENYIWKVSFTKEALQIYNLHIRMDFAIIISNIDKYGDTYSEILFVQNT